MFDEIKESLRSLYLEDPRPWLIGFSGGKDSTMVASLIFEVVLEIPREQRIKPISVVCTDTRVEIPAIVEMIEGTLARMQKCSTADMARDTGVEKLRRSHRIVPFALEGRACGRRLQRWREFDGTG